MDLALNNPQRLICHKTQPTNSWDLFSGSQLYTHSPSPDTVFQKVSTSLGLKEKAWYQLHKNAESNIEQVLGAAPYKTAAVRLPTTHHVNYPN